MKNDADLSDIDIPLTLNLIRPTETAVLDKQLTFTQISAGFNRLIGMSGAQLNGTLLTETLWEFVGVEQELKGILLGKSEQFVLENVYHSMPDGSDRYLSFVVTGNPNQNPPRTLLLIVEDSSDVGRLQQSLIQDRNELRLARQQLASLNSELAQLNRLKSLFLSMAAHDLRTPLSSIQGFTELLRDELPQDDVQRRDLFDVILGQAYRLQQLINDLLDLDQVERGKILVIHRDCHLDEIIGEVHRAMRPLSNRASVTVEIDYPEKPIKIVSDPQRLSQILYNLLSNAVKFTPSGGHVRIAVFEQENNVQIDVVDEGQGISQSEMDDLFAPYFPQARIDRLKRNAGSGLGLYIVSLLVEALGGQISVSSVVGKGTAFSIVLPKSHDNKET